ncbi:MAG: CPBP family intramembrane metalloprotease, partial [Myxococcales bacterium]|nr:CPBP family intramembrane metalloprotease [Myxococcales bacterium]
MSERLPRRAVSRRRAVWLVFRKELRETLRDWRTLTVMVLLPLALYPALGVGVSQFVGVELQRRAAHVSRVAIVGEPWPELAARLQKSAKLSVTDAPTGQSLPRAIKRGAIDAAVVLRGRVAEDGRSTPPKIRVELYYDQTRPVSRQARRRVREALDKLARELVDRRLGRRGLSRLLIEPLDIESSGVATQRQVSSHTLRSVLPMLVILMVLLGAFYPAIDLTAGEKERGTLETLLTSPAPRRQIITGKFLVVATIATVTGLLNLASIGVTFALGFDVALAKTGIASHLPWSSLAMTVIAMVPAALFFAAVMVGVATTARSFKQAQTLLTPVYLVCIVPAVLATIPTVKLDMLTAVLPAINVALMVRELIGGNLQLVPTIIAVLTTTTYAVIALRIATHIYSSERLLYSDDERRSRKKRARQPLGDRPLPADAGMLFLFVMAAFMLIGQRLQANDLVLGLLATEWLIIALPVMLFLRLRNLDPRAVLSLQPPSARSLIGAALAGVSAWLVVAVLVEGVQQRFMPMPREMIQQSYKAIFSSGRPLALDLFVFAVSPAICEELLFRGVLLRASYPALGTRNAALLSGLLFGLFHLSIYRFVPTGILGVVLALIAIRSGSILPSMLFHALNNAATFIVARALGPEASPPWTYVAGAAVVFVAGM